MYSQEQSVCQTYIKIICAVSVHHTQTQSLNYQFQNGLSDLTQHSLSSGLLNLPRYLTSHQLIKEVFKNIPWKALIKIMSQLLHCCSLLQLQSTFMYLLKKPNSFRGIMLDLSIKLRWKSLCQNQCSIIIVMSRHVHFIISNQKYNRFTDNFFHIHGHTPFYATVMQGNYPRLHSQQIGLTL